MMPEWNPPNSMEELQVGAELDHCQREEIRSLLSRFPEVVSAGLEELSSSTTGSLQPRPQYVSPHTASPGHTTLK